MKNRKVLSYKTVKLILFREAANLICWFRILVSVALMLVTRPAWGWAVFYSLAFLSDVWDGWCYRRVPEAERPRHWFNRLPLTLDPLADFVFVCGGIIYMSEVKGLGVVVCLILTVIMIMYNVIAAKSNNRVFTVMMTTLTYFWFTLMATMMLLVWCCSTTIGICLVGSTTTVAAFYASFFRNRDKSRTIRKRG